MKKTVFILLAFIASFQVVAQDDGGEPPPPSLGFVFNRNSINYIVTSTSPARVAVNNNGSFAGVATIPAATSFTNYYYTTYGYSVTSIGFGFNGATGLTAVTIPTSITSIGTSSFANCTGLTTVTVNWTTPVAIVASTFQNVSLSAVTLSIPNGTLAAYQAAPVWQNFNLVERIALPVLGQEFTSGGIKYKITRATTPYRVEVGLNGDYDQMDGMNTGFSGNATIPATVTHLGNQFDVTAIGANAFISSPSLSGITLPSSITSIGVSAFRSCSGLTAITLPSNMSSIGASAFQGCLGLTAITLPSYMSSIGAAAFAGCSGLTAFSLPANGISSIQSDTFSGCTALASISIPNAVTSIGANAFEGCTALQSITIPNAVTTIGARAFLGSGLTTITLPNAVTSIGESAFNSCSSLTAATLPSSVTSMGEFVFSLCSALQTVTVNWLTPLVINPNVFATLSLSSRTLNVPIGTLAAYQAAAVWQDFGTITQVIPPPVLGQEFTAGGIKYKITSATVPYTAEVAINTSFVGVANIPASVDHIGNTFSVTRIGNEAFFNCGGLASVVLPSSLLSIGAKAFENCPGLYTIVIPNAVTTIEERAFRECFYLTSITIPNSVTTIGGSAFASCIGLTAITLPNNLSVISTQLLYECTGLQSLIIPNSVTEIKNVAFAGCTGLTSITIPNTVTSIGFNAFESCSALTSITLPNALTTLSSGILGKCSGLTTISIPPSVTSIDVAAFQGCSGLTSVVIPNTVTSIGSSAFRDCNNLSSIILPNTLTTISSEMFSRCSSLTSILIPETVTSIAGSAFRFCTSLNTINIPAAVSSIGGFSFGSCTALQTFNVNWATPIAINADVFHDLTLNGRTLNVPSGTAALYDAAAVWTNFNPIVEQVAVTPVAPAFTAIAPICSGTTLTALPITSTNNITGTWFPALNNTATTTYIFTPNTGQNATTATLEIVVNTTALPTASGNQSFNTGATLANVVVTGSNLKWYNAMTSGTMLPSSTPLVNGTTYYVSQTANSCESGRVAVTVTTSSSCVTPTLSTVTAASACLGNTITIVLSGLIPNTAGVATYTVGNSGLVTQAGTSNANGMFSFTSPATANLNGLELSITKITTTAGCETAFADKKVTLVVTPFPTLSTVTAAPTCAGSAAMVVLSGLNPNTAGIATYKVGGGPLVTQAGTSDANGTFSFPTNLLPADANGVVIEITKLATLGGCVTNFTNKKVTLVVNRCVRAAKPVSGKENVLTDETATVILYPNPATDVLNIEASLGIQSVEIFNNIGQRVLTSTQKQINVSDLPSGVYLVRIQDLGNNVETKKVIIK